jgi:hypothetical protein
MLMRLDQQQYRQAQPMRLPFVHAKNRAFKLGFTNLHLFASRDSDLGLHDR